MAPFQYDPLDSTKKEIRLVIGNDSADKERDDDSIRLLMFPATLHGSPGGDGVKNITIQNVSTGETEDANYYALSYTWGAPFEGLDPEWDDPQATHVIYVNGCEFRVRRNLGEALHSLQRSGKLCARPVWIDAICINQDDVGEREQQVRLMDEIYASSTSSIVWLGPASNDSDLAIRAMRNLSFSWGRRTEPFDDRNLSILTSELESQYLELAAREIGGKRAEAELLAITRFFLRHWFHRVWVAQEFVLAPAAMLICGTWDSDHHQIISAKVLCDVCDIMFQHRSLNHHRIGRDFLDMDLLSPLIWAVMEASSHFRNLATTWGDFRSIGPEDIHDVLHYTRQRLATDPRDKLFAVLGFCLPADGGLVHVDYASPVRAVYTAFVRNWISRESSLFILGLVLHPSPMPRLPSWVVDWTIASGREWPESVFGGVRHPLGGRSKSGTDTTRYAAGSDYPLAFGFEDDGYTLVLQGVHVARIMQIHRPEDGGSAEDSGLQGPSRVTTTAEEYILRYQDTPRRSLWDRLEPGLDWIGLVLTGRESGPATNPNDEDIMIAKDLEEILNDRIYACTGETLLNATFRTLSGDLGFDSREGKPGRRLQTWTDVRAWGDSVELWYPFLIVFGFMRKGRTLFITDKGHLGYGPDFSEPGDDVFVIPGHETPMVLRRLPGANRFRFIGECYVHGIMDGEALAGYTTEVNGQKTVRTETLYLV